MGSIPTKLALTTLGAARVEIRRDTRDEHGAAVARRLFYVLEETREGVHEGVPRRAEAWVPTRPVRRWSRRAGPKAGRRSRQAGEPAEHRAPMLLFA